MNASSSPPPGGPARTVFEIGAPIDTSAPEGGSTSARGRVIAWSGFAVVIVLGIALTNLAGLGDQSSPRIEPAAARQPPLTWNSPVTDPVVTADAADTAGQNPDSDLSAAPATKPKAAKKPVSKPAAKPKAKPTPRAVVPTGDQGLVQPGTRCRNKRHRGHTQNGTPMDCRRRHRGEQLSWQLPQPGQDGTAWGAQTGNGQGWQGGQGGQGWDDNRPDQESYP